MKTRLHHKTRSGFTLAEMLLVVTIIGVLAALTMQGYTYAMRSSKRRVTESTLAAAQSSLERYFDKFGEYPEPASNKEEIEIMPNKKYNVAGARCLYQALRGDGFDAIKLGTSNSDDKNAASDGKFDDSELGKVMFKDMPQAMWRTVGSKTYILVDGFGFPFQYVKAVPQTNNTSNGNNGGSNSDSNAVVTINSTYDLWSYADDEKNITATSAQAQKDSKVSAKWVKNW